MVVAVAEGDDDELKPIDEVVGRVPPVLLELAVWMADEYRSTARRWRCIPPRPPKRALKARDDFPDPDVAVVRRLTDAQRAAVAGCLEAAAGEREVLLHGVRSRLGQDRRSPGGDRAGGWTGGASCWCPRSRSPRRRPVAGSATPSQCCTAR